MTHHFAISLDPNATERIQVNPEANWSHAPEDEEKAAECLFELFLILNTTK